MIFSRDLLDLTSTLVEAFRLRPPASSTTGRSSFTRSKVRKCLLSFVNGIPSPYPSPWMALSTPKPKPNNLADSDEGLHPVRSTYPPLCQTQSEAALCLLSRIQGYADGDGWGGRVVCLILDLESQNCECPNQPRYLVRSKQYAKL